MFSDGALENLRSRLKDTEDREVGKSVNIGGYVFQDVSSVRAVFDLLGDDQIYRFDHDMKDQLIGCMDDHFVGVHVQQGRCQQG